MKMPNGHILPDFISWGDFGRKDTPLSASWLFEIPGFQHDTDMVANGIHTKLDNTLKAAHAVGENSSIQLQWSVSSDFGREQLMYDADTEKYATNPVTKFFRNQRSERNWERMRKGLLRREKTIISLNVPCGASIPNNLSDKELKYAFLSLYRSRKQVFDNFGSKMRSFFCGDAYKIKRLSAADMKAELDGYLNASRKYRNPQYNPFSNSEWQKLSIQQNVANSGFVGNKCKITENNFGFFWDNMYHEIIVLKNYPDITNPGAFYALTSLDMADYSITVNLHPTNSRKLQKQIDKQIKRLVNESEGNKNYGHKTSIQNLQKRLDDLKSGSTVPFLADYIIRVWDKNKNNLQSKISAITSAVESMNGAGCQQISLASSTKSLFYSSWTGASHSKYKNYRLPATNRFISDMLPIGSTYVGNLDGAMALYDGDNKNICGIKTFIQGTPQNSFYIRCPGVRKISPY